MCLPHFLTINYHKLCQYIIDDLDVLFPTGPSCNCMRPRMRVPYPRALCRIDRGGGGGISWHRCKERARRIHRNGGIRIVNHHPIRILWHVFSFCLADFSIIWGYNCVLRLAEDYHGTATRTKKILERLSHTHIKTLQTHFGNHCFYQRCAFSYVIACVWNGFFPTPYPN